MAKKLKQSTELYLKAAEMLGDFTNEYSCIAIKDAAQEADGDTFWVGAELRDKYVDLFMPQTGEVDAPFIGSRNFPWAQAYFTWRPENGWKLTEEERSELREFRILLLCMMAAIEEAGDAE